MRLKLMILALLWLSMLVGCLCRDILPFWTMEGLRLELRSTDSMLSILAEGDTLRRDTLLIELLPEAAYHAAQLPFMPTAAYATSCLPQGFDGLSDSLTGWTLTCDQPIGAVPAGASLADVAWDRQWAGEPLSVDFLNLISGEEAENGDIGLLLSPPPTTGEACRFQLSFTFASGKVLTAESAAIVWE